MDESVATKSLGQELRFYWGQLPDRGLFLAVAAAWLLLFQYFGLTTMVAGHTASLFSWMWGKWEDPANDSSHAKLIPFVVAGLLWWRREKLAAAIKDPWWPALAGLALALLIHVAGYLVQQPRISMIGLFSGIWCLVGLLWGRRALQLSFFPFFIFAFCVPMGGTFAQGLTLPLRLLATKGAFCVTHGMLDVNVARDGTMLYDPAGVYGRFDIAAQCSGIRSFIALTCITTIFSVVAMRKWWKRMVILLSTIPLALFFNMIRVTLIVLAANAFKTAKAGEFVDSYFGYFTYAAAVGAVFALAWLLREKPAAGVR